MSEDHKPLKKEEKERILRAGGTVSWENRVNDELNMSRAFGDYVYKGNKKLSETEQMVIALPDVRTHTVDPSKYILKYL